MAATQWQAINMAGSGTMVSSGAGGGGAGGDGNDPSKRSGLKAPAFTRISQREYLRLIAEQFEGKRIKARSINAGILQILCQILEENEGALKGAMRISPLLRTWANGLTAGAPQEIVRNPQFRNPEMDVNFKGGDNYGPAILAGSSRGAEIHQNGCNRCRRGLGWFAQCITFTGIFKGACIGCAVGNHFDQCDFFLDPTQAHASGSGLPRSQSNVSMSNTGSPSNTGGLVQSGSNQSLISQSSSQVDEQHTQPGNIWGLRASDNATVRHAHELPPRGTGSQRTQIMFNLNTSARHNTERSWAEEVRSILREIVDDDEVWKASWTRKRKP